MKSDYGIGHKVFFNSTHYPETFFETGNAV